MVAVFVGIGSNLGRRRVNIKNALSYLNGIDGIQIEKVSTLIKTKPLGGPVQRDYFNGVIKLRTVYPARQFLKVLQLIEQRMGRVRTVKNGPRVIDLDILLYGNEIINEPDLVVPHVRMKYRDFVMRPLREIEPDIDCVIKELIQ